MKHKNKRPEHVIFRDDKITEEGGAASATDYTGMIPSAPANEEQRKSYEEILDYTPGETDGKAEQAVRR